MTALADHRIFWRACQIVTLILHVLGLGFLFFQGARHPVALLWLIVLTIHILELPMAFVALHSRPQGAATIVLATLIFGFTWWLPARRGVFDG